MSTDAKRDDSGESDRQPRTLSVPVATVAALLSAVVAGGGGSYLTGSSVSATMREGQIRMEGQLQSLRDEVRRLGDDQRAVIVRLDAADRAMDERIRAVELHMARMGATPPR